jgi:chromosome segregation ATPase
MAASADCDRCSLFKQKWKDTIMENAKLQNENKQLKKQLSELQNEADTLKKDLELVAKSSVEIAGESHAHYQLAKQRKEEHFADEAMKNLLDEDDAKTKSVLKTQKETIRRLQDRIDQQKTAFQKCADEQRQQKQPHAFKGFLKAFKKCFEVPRTSWPSTPFEAFIRPYETLWGLIKPYKGKTF